MHLKVDSREQNESIMDTLSELGVDYEIEALTVGDYLWCDDCGNGVICIEHKSVMDFRSSVMNNHLDTQIHDIKQYPYYALFTVGDWRLAYGKAFKSPFTKRMKEHKILSIEVKHKVPCHHFEDPLSMVVGLIHLERTVEGQRGVEEVVRHTHTRNKHDANFQMYSAMDGMGYKKILSVMEDYPCILDLFDDFRSDGLRNYPRKKINKTTRDFLQRLVDCE